ncbi:unnamed protein product, partial [marine sediment metagenome]
VFWRPSPNDSDLLPCETCPVVTECNIYASLSSGQEYPSTVIKLDNQKDSEQYRIGDILVDKSRAAIEFTGSIANDVARYR